MKKTLAIVAGAALVVSAHVAEADTLKVGAAETYKTPCDAIGAAKPNDVVEVDPGTYTDTCAIGVAGLTVRGVGGRPKIDVSGTDHPALYKGAYVIQADGVRIENLEITGAHISDANGANGAGLRIEGHDAVVHGCYIHDNQDGMLVTPQPAGGTVTVEYTELAHNALGNGCNLGGCTHNIYTNGADKLVFQFNWTHDIANDTADKGHLFKSRAKASYLLYNRITGEGGHDSYAVDLPNGGLAVVVGNVIQKGPAGDNSTLLYWGEEGATNPDKRVFIVNNTFVNDAGKGTMIDITNGGALTTHNNVFVGAGTPVVGGTLSADDLTGQDPLFVDPASYDYHLKAGSPAIDKGVDPGSADAFSLTPTSEYVHPLKGVPRASDGKIDRGAFEFGTDVNVDGGVGDAATHAGDGGGSSSGSSGASSGSSGTSGGSSGSSGASGSGGSGGGAQDDGGATGGDGAGPGGGSSGCGASGKLPGSTIGLALAALLVARRRRRAW